MAIEPPAMHRTTILRAATCKMTLIININEQNFRAAQTSCLGTQIFLASPLVDDGDDDNPDYLRLEREVDEIKHFESRTVKKMTERMNLKQTGTMMHIFVLYNHV